MILVYLLCLFYVLLHIIILWVASAIAGLHSKQRHKEHVPNERAWAKIQQAVGLHKDLTIVKRFKLQWYHHIFHSPGLAKITVKVWRRQGVQRKRLEDNIDEWTNLQFAKSQSAVQWRKGKLEKIGCKVTCGATTTLTVKGFMMVMMKQTPVWSCSWTNGSLRPSSRHIFWRA